MSRLLLARSDWRFTRSRYASPRTSSPLLSQLLKNAPGLLVLADALLSQYKSQIVDFTIRTQLPAVFPLREFTELGGLMSYGPSLPDMFRMGANYVDKILKGAKPADLPIEQPTKFQFWINLKTARTLGLEIPPHLLALVDDVIE